VFLAAGATAAIGTQWVANDVSAALWTAKFLCAIREQSHDVLESACSTSRWIKQSSLQEKKALLESCPDRLPEQLEGLLAKDFTQPFFWANHKFCGASLPRKQ
jgi:CHAT domain-containing protein